MLAYLFVALAVAVRFMPHPWHFTPVAAALLYFGARGSKRQLWLPVAALIVSDLLLTKYVYGLHFSVDIISSWLWYAAVAWLGTKLRDNSKPAFILGAALASSVAFFVVSNFGVWLVWNFYPRTLEGLIACYVVAIPFFRQALEGDVLFTAAMFGLPALARILTDRLDASRDHAAAA